MCYPLIITMHPLFLKFIKNGLILISEVTCASVSRKWHIVIITLGFIPILIPIPEREKIKLYDKFHLIIDPRCMMKKSRDSLGSAIFIEGLREMVMMGKQDLFGKIEWESFIESVKKVRIALDFINKEYCNKKYLN